MRILCYGDSNTWGYNPLDATRYNHRWTKELQKLLPHDEIIEEGLNGRTFRDDDPTWPGRNGLKVLPVLLRTHRPVDLIIVMLGSNDLKIFHNMTEEKLAEGLKETIKVIRDENLAVPYEVPHILVVSPAELGKGITTTSKWAEYFTEESYRVSLKTADVFKSVCAREKTFFFDASSVARASDYDSLHLDEDQHGVLATALSVEINRIRQIIMEK